MVAVSRIFLSVLFGMLLMNISVANAEVKIDTKIIAPNLKNAVAHVDNSNYFKMYGLHFDVTGNFGKAQWVWKPSLNYRFNVKPEVHLAESYVRLPFGVCSLYGGVREIAWGCYYRLPKQGLFGAISKDIHDGSFNEGIPKGMTATAGILFPDLGKSKNSSVKISCQARVDDTGRHKRNSITVANERKLKQGHILSYSLSNNDRKFDGKRITNYSVLQFAYNHKVREGFTIKLGCGLSWADKINSGERNFSPYWLIQLKMFL